MDRGDYNIPFAFLKKHGDKNANKFLIAKNTIFSTPCISVWFIKRTPLTFLMDGVHIWHNGCLGFTYQPFED